MLLPKRSSSLLLPCPAATPSSPTQTTTTSGSRTPSRPAHPETPPTFTIDLSLPPEHRYDAVCAAYHAEINNIPALFDEVLSAMCSDIPLRWIHLTCRALFRKVYDSEENRELLGISRATGVEMYLLVSFNVLLDLFMGCSSGGAAVKDTEGTGGDYLRTKMIHFRTLDWGMPSLRRSIVQYDYKRRADGEVVASSLSYAGYVGLLTGVRKGLSLSMNFRLYRSDMGSLGADVRYFWHLFRVVCGKRRCLASELRRVMVPRTENGRLTYEEAVKIFGCNDKKRTRKTTACYLCLSNGTETTVIEKDYRTARTKASEEFVVVTNFDQTQSCSTTTQPSLGRTRREAWLTSGDLEPIISGRPWKDPRPIGMEDLLADAEDRHMCAEQNYCSIRRRREADCKGEYDVKSLVTEEDVTEMVQKYPTTNEETHFACIMDPKEGRVKWCRMFVKPIDAQWVRSHLWESPIDFSKGPEGG